MKLAQACEFKKEERKERIETFKKFKECGVRHLNKLCKNHDDHQHNRRRRELISR